MSRFPGPLVCLGTVILAGCGTVFGGTTETISIQSSPAAVSISTNPSTGSFTTPASIELDRKDNYTITATKEGYTDGQAFVRKKIRSGVLVADILLGGWFLIDYLTGGLWDLSPDQVLVTLERKAENFDGPEKIEIILSASGGGALEVSSPQGRVSGLSLKIEPVR